MYLSPEWAGLCCKVGAMTRTPSGGRARPCDAHSAPGCSVTCPRHRARKAGSTCTDQSFIYKKKKLKPVLNSSRSCSGPSRDENPVFGSHRIPQDPTGPPGAPPRALLPGHSPRLSAVCPSGSHEEEHCLVSELLHQPETQEEEAALANTDSVSNVKQPVTLHGITEPKSNKRPVLN